MNELKQLQIQIDCLQGALDAEQHARRELAKTLTKHLQSLADEIQNLAHFPYDRYGLPFGGCPICGYTGAYRNLGREHWFYCPEHKCKWHIGANLFSAWKDESEAVWQENAKYLSDFLVIEPVGDLRETEDWKSGKRAEILDRVAKRNQIAVAAEDVPF
jgi:hypothetical protein